MNNANIVTQKADCNSLAVKSLNNQPETDEVKTPFDPVVILELCKVDPLKEIDEPPTAIEIHSNGKAAPTFTLGNFSLIIGKAKSKKTFLLSCLASAATSNSWALDSIRGVLPTNKRNLLYFDTEQSEYHLYRTIKRVCRLTNESNPENFKAFGLRRFKPDQRLKLIEFALYNTQNIGIAFIDGGRDLLSLGINDEKQATDTTSDFLRWTAELNIHLVVILHQNKTDLNARGHFGTECLNKAESTLSVTKSTDNPDISIVECEYSRDIAFEPFAFTIDENGLPIPCDLPEKGGVKPSTHPDLLAKDQHFIILNAIFKANPEPKYRELWQSIKLLFGEQGVRFGDNRAKDFAAYYLQNNWISKNGQGYKYNRAIF